MSIPAARGDVCSVLIFLFSRNFKIVFHKLSEHFPMKYERHQNELESYCQVVLLESFSVFFKTFHESGDFHKFSDYNLPFVCLSY